MDERMTTEEIVQRLKGLSTFRRIDDNPDNTYLAAARRLTLLAKVVAAVKKQGDNSPNTERALAALAADLPTPTTEER